MFQSTPTGKQTTCERLIRTQYLKLGLGFYIKQKKLIFFMKLKLFYGCGALYVQ
jgi:hypothetical protein